MKEKVEIKSTIYPNGVVSRIPNRRIAVLDSQTGGVEITFWVVDGTNAKRARTANLKSKGSVMCFSLSNAGIEALHLTINEYLRTRLSRKIESSRECSED